MKIKKENRSFTGFGIGCFVVLGIVMIVRFYLKTEDEQFIVRIFEGAWRFVCTFFGAGVVWLVLFFMIYIASKISPVIFNEEKEDISYMDHFMSLSNPIFIVGYIVSYIAILLEL
jgi:hypothetical protein